MEQIVSGAGVLDHPSQNEMIIWNLSSIKVIGTSGRNTGTLSESCKPLLAVLLGVGNLRNRQAGPRWSNVLARPASAALPR